MKPLKLSRSTVNAFLGIKPDLVQERKEMAETASDIFPTNLQSTAATNGGKLREEDNYLTNFVNGSIHVFATHCNCKCF